MGKNKFVGHAPRPTKTELHKAAQEQHKVNEAKAAEEAAAPPAEATGAADPTALVSPATETNAPVAEEPAAPAAPVGEEAAPPAPPAPKKTEATLYALGKKYVPKTDRNSDTWGKLTAALRESPKTMKQLQEVAAGHKDFIGYMTRGGHIIPHVAVEVLAAAAN